ncbi:WUSCHEL-related homeobox 11-like [Zingiber officinale]|uniref:WUSCHEL-related homeobox 11-like n=1 Tax=Zingiber officinale TaxID=94328 RepID=UPI001C4BF048|nr:WUSCHEL-related homeobox 11-like [Zingiber officinale]
MGDQPPNDKKEEQVVLEPAVRSRWTPKPEQILILESIFNSGMVNPPKEETARIRSLLEKFGAVGDANVFYWFQNRRSRSRRRQRQLQAGLAAAVASSQDQHVISSSSSSSSSASTATAVNDSFASSSVGFFPYAPSSSSSSSSSSGGDLLSISSHMGFSQRRTQDMNPFERSSGAAPQLQHQPSGTITVFINGVLSEVPRGTFDMRSMFGYNWMLVHSSGEVVPLNEYGFLMQSLQMGESYFLVSSST